jgi:hypothetical protein
MGRYARNNFCSDPFSMKAAVHCSGTTPESCVVDGVQLGSGCTLGKRNIEIVVGPAIRCVFESNGKKLVLTPTPYTPPPKNDHYEAAIEQFAEHLLQKPDAELFTIGQT